MRAIRLRPLRGAAWLVCGALASACATPASDVRVATMPMRDALARSRAPDGALPGATTAASTLTPAAQPPDLPHPIVTLPDVRLAYLYEWVDADGNRHFGGWVAIAVSASRWILSDGSSAPLDAGNAVRAPRATMAQRHP
jgi:hypothetical protein